jgi:hypothetical protein
VIGLGSGTSASVSAVALSKYAIPVKPSTSYKFTGYFNFVNLVSTTAIINIQEFNTAGTRLVANAVQNSVGTSGGYVERSATFTTNASTAYIVMAGGAINAGDAQEVYYDYDDPESGLFEVTSITNAGSTPALYYPSATAVSSTDNIDQSQVVSDSARALGDNTRKYHGEQFLPTKKNYKGVVLQRGATTGTYVGDVIVSIVNSVADTPTGSTLASVTIPNATWLGYSVDTDFTVALPCTLTVDGSTKYWIKAESTTNDASNYTRIKNTASASAYPQLYKDSNDNVTWNTVAADMYFKTLYSKNTTNFTVSTDTQTVSVTAPTVDGWENGTIVTFDTPLTLAPGANNIYVSSNGPSTASSDTDPSLQGVFSGSYVN